MPQCGLDAHRSARIKVAARDKDDCHKAHEYHTKYQAGLNLLPSILTEDKYACYSQQRQEYPVTKRIVLQYDEEDT